MRRVLLAACLLVLVRTAVWWVWEHSFFDSDQAVTGLMATHLAEGRAMPVFIYGQGYLLAVDAWLAAPVVRVFGPSVAAIKLPMVVLNLLIAWLLLRLLVRDAVLTPWAAFVSAMFFLLPPPITGSRLMELSSGLDPLLYPLLLWMTRSRPVLFGIIAGFGFMHREFVVYPIIALTVVEAWSGMLFNPRHLARRALSLLAALIVVAMVGAVALRSDALGPGTSGATSAPILRTHEGGWTTRICWDSANVLSNVGWAFQDNLGMILGWRPRYIPDHVNSRVLGGHPWTLAVFALLSAVGIVTAVTHLRRRPPETRRGDAPPAATPGTFTGFLMLTGVLAFAAYAVFSCLVRDYALIRYTLLALYIPIGLTAWLLSTIQSRISRIAITAAVIAWAVPCAIDTGKTLEEYLQKPPVNEYRNLATYLEAESIRYGRAPYWTAYAIDFLSNERVILASSEVERIKPYRDVVDAHPQEAVVIQDADATCFGERMTRLGRWCLIRP